MKFGQITYAKQTQSKIRVQQIFENRQAKINKNLIKIHPETAYNTFSYVRENREKWKSNKQNVHVHMQQQPIRKLTKEKSIATDGKYLFTMIQQRNLSHMSKSGNSAIMLPCI